VQCDGRLVKHTAKVGDIGKFSVVGKRREVALPLSLELARLPLSFRVDLMLLTRLGRLGGDDRQHECADQGQRGRWVRGENRGSRGCHERENSHRDSER
jgi:hypothetical protein